MALSWYARLIAPFTQKLGHVIDGSFVDINDAYLDID